MGSIFIRGLGAIVRELRATGAGILGREIPDVKHARNRRGPDPTLEPATHGRGNFQSGDSSAVTSPAVVGAAAISRAAASAQEEPPRVFAVAVRPGLHSDIAMAPYFTHGALLAVLEYHNQEGRFDAAWERFESRLADAQSVRDASLSEGDLFGLGPDDCEDSASNAVLKEV